MLKLHFGCGGNHLHGWRNHDTDIDITKLLPFENDSVDYIFSEHCIEHQKPVEVWTYFEECLRILKPGGVVRTTFPDIAKTMREQTQSYRDFIRTQGWGDGSVKSGVQHLVFLHGHQSIWTQETVSAIVEAIGFSMWYATDISRSRYPELRGVEQHWRAIGVENNAIESVSVEAVK